MNTGIINGLLLNGQTFGTFNISSNFFCPVTSTANALGNNYVSNGVMINAAINPVSLVTFTPVNGITVRYNNFFKVWNGVSMTGLQNPGYLKVTGSNYIKLEPHVNVNAVQRGINYAVNGMNIINSNTVVGVTTTSTNVSTGIFASMNSFIMSLSVKEKPMRIS